MADGVGGLPYGEVASWEIVQACTAIHAADLSFMDRLEWLEDRLLAANHTLYQAGMTAPQAFTMASTVVAAQVEDDRAGLFWAGDSRAYLRHHGRLLQLTTDHVELRDRRRLVTRLWARRPTPNFDFRIVQIDPVRGCCCARMAFSSGCRRRCRCDRSTSSDAIWPRRCWKPPTAIPGATTPPPSSCAMWEAPHERARSVSPALRRRP